VVAAAVGNGIPVPAFASSLSYFDGLRRERGPANLIQGLRDLFGAHTYRRLDGGDESHHTQWGTDGG
jgi:6-phosphogluconate dehydrogenase